MIALLSYGPLSAERSDAYLRIVAETPLAENAWERVAVVEAKEVIRAASDERDEYLPLRGLAAFANSSAAPRTDAARVALAETLAAFVAEETVAAGDGQKETR